MLTKSFSSSHGSSLIAAAAIAVAAFAGLVGTASASIIYQDNFTGGTANLDGAAPTIDNGTSATWSSYEPGWSDNGNFTTASSGGLAYLSFKPSKGNIYTLTAGLLDTSSNWIALGFAGTANTSDQITSDGIGWTLVAKSNGGGDFFTGPGTAGPTAFSDTVGVNTISTVLNTEGSSWTIQGFVNGTAVAPAASFTAPPTIAGVGFFNNDANGTVSNFELSSAAVPEPASLGLVAAGGLGLLLLKRRRAV